MQIPIQIHVSDLIFSKLNVQKNYDSWGRGGLQGLWNMSYAIIRINQRRSTRILLYNKPWEIYQA